MKRHFFFAITLFLFILASAASARVLADAKSDYDYQYGRYRSGYSEFAILKQDYLNTPSLDNQQKAMLSAKQTILARDLAKASLHWYLTDLIGSYNVDYEPIKPVLGSLNTARSYFLTEAQKSQSIITQSDLKSFTKNYLASVPRHDSIIKFGIVANKIAGLVRIQTDSRNALEALLPRLPDPLPTSLAARIQELKDSMKVIDNKINALAATLNLSDAEAESATQIFFTSKVEKLIEIRALQLDWIDRLIDIDINYVQLQI